MKLIDVEQAKVDYSGRASDVSRQLAFAGIAVVWILRDDKAAQPISMSLVPALTAFVAVLALDILHYASSSLIWTVYYNRLVKRGIGEGDNFDEPRGINWPGYMLFGTKIVVLLCGWLALTSSLVLRWKLLS